MKTAPGKTQPGAARLLDVCEAGVVPDALGGQPGGLHEPPAGQLLACFLGDDQPTVQPEGDLTPMTEHHPAVRQHPNGLPQCSSIRHHDDDDRTLGVERLGEPGDLAPTLHHCGSTLYPRIRGLGAATGSGPIATTRYVLPNSPPHRPGVRLIVKPRPASLANTSDNDRMRAGVHAPWGSIHRWGWHPPP